MATLTFSPAAPRSGHADRAPARRSLLRRIADRLIEARMAEARRHVDAYLMTLDDATLARYGVTRAEVEASTHRPVAY